MANTYKYTRKFHAGERYAPTLIQSENYFGNLESTVAVEAKRRSITDTGRGVDLLHYNATCYIIDNYMLLFRTGIIRLGKMTCYIHEWFVKICGGAFVGKLCEMFTFQANANGLCD